MLGTSLTRVKTNAERADEQLDEILGVVDNWNLRWLEDQVSEELHWEHFGILSSAVVPREIPELGIRVETRAPLWTLHPAPLSLRSSKAPHPLGESFAYFPYGSDKRPLIVDPPQSVGEFKDLWDGLRDPVPVYAPEKIANEAYVYVIGDDYTAPDGVKRVPLIPSREETLPVAKLILDALDEQEIERVDSELTSLSGAYTHAYVGATGEPEREVTRIIVPVRTKIVNLNGQRSFLNSYALDWNMGPTPRAFLYFAEVRRSDGFCVVGPAHVQ